MVDAGLGIQVGGVRLDAEIGRGGMGIVYRGFQVALSRTVAVKVVRGSLAQDEEFRHRFQRECEIAASLEHPHVIPIYSADSDEGQLSVTMRFVDGPDLGAFLRDRGPMRPDVAAQVLSQIAGALDTAHQRGLVHRDVKPANILVGSVDGRLHTYLTDFGLSRATADARLTGTGTLLGTPGYMAPEQYEDGQPDARADVYALGCVLFECLTGRMPFVRDSAPALMCAHLSETPPAVGSVVTGVPDRVDPVIRRAMAKRPEDRYPTAGELARELTAATATGHPDVSTPSPPPPRDPAAAPTMVPPPRQGDDAARQTHWLPSHDSRTANSSSTGFSPFGGGGRQSPFGGGGQQPPFGHQTWPPVSPLPSWPNSVSPGPVTKRRPRWLTVGLPVGAVVLVLALIAVVVLVSPGSVGRIAGAPIPVGRTRSTSSPARASSGPRTRTTARSRRSIRPPVSAGRSPWAVPPTRWWPTGARCGSTTTPTR